MRGLLDDEGLLHRIGMLARAETFERHDVAPGAALDRDHAGARGDAVDQHRAGAAFAEPAAIFRSVQGEIVAQHIEPSDIQLLAHMEKLAGSSGGPPQASTVAAPAESSPGSTAPQTVSNGLTSAKFTLPANYDDLSDQEQRTIMARVLEERVPGAKKKPRG